MLTEGKYINAIRNAPELVGEFCEKNLEDDAKAKLQDIIIPPPTPEAIAAESAAIEARLRALVSSGAITPERLVQKAAEIAAETGGN